MSNFVHNLMCLNLILIKRYPDDFIKNLSHKQSERDGNNILCWLDDIFPEQWRLTNLCPLKDGLDC